MRIFAPRNLLSDIMELRQLRYFVRSAELLNFTEAARTLFITESTLSLQIKQLETELNTPLFERVKRSVILTEAGKTFLPYAQKTLRDAENAVQRLNDLNRILTGNLCIGVTYSLASLLTNTLLQFSHAYPGIKLNIVYRTATDLLDMLKNRQVDFVLSYEPVNTDKMLESRRLFDAMLSVVVHHHHPLAALKQVSLNQVDKFPLVLPSKGLNARSILDRALEAHNLSLSPQVELNEVNILFHLIKTKHWITVLSSATVHNEPDLKAVPLKEKVGMHAALLWLKDGYQKNSAREFMRMLAQESSLQNSLP